MDMVKKRKFITEPEVRYWTVQMAGAIKYMHAKGIIHRDLKMGNIFLDKNMNVKIGDFGLAALLMSGKELQAARRTTLCGTPNYIAPEILAKDKGGHDHAVDIWSLGIIMYVQSTAASTCTNFDRFAMLTGKPPFQSATPEEIYRRARAREYDWPNPDTSENFISEDTKELVADLLKAPEERPDPDTIVQHPFFRCGWMPQSEEITPSLRERHPEPTQFMAAGLRVGREKVIIRNMKKLCIKCEVGPWNPSPTRYTSTYRECAQEEKHNLTPKVPLADDIVYRPFHEWLEEQARAIEELGDDSAATADDTIIKSTAPTEARPPTISRPISQSFAAQQRSRPQISSTTQQNRFMRRQPGQEPLPRPTISALGRKYDAPAPPPVPEGTVDVDDRLATDLVNRLKLVEPEAKGLDIAPKAPLSVSPSIFSPKEAVEYLPQTRPDVVLEGLRKLQAELQRALNSRSQATNVEESSSNSIVVVKWVDYTNKFGLGYILSNGSVGCIFKKIPVDPTDINKGMLPTSGLVVRGAEHHLRHRANAKYPDRSEVVPMSGHNVEFYEHTSDKGVAGLKVNPQTYKLPPSEDGQPSRLAVGSDEWDVRRRNNLVLWKKFGNYMVAYGRDQDYYSEQEMNRMSDAQSSAPGNVITFYQRWGDVGCWFFGDGHAQVSQPLNPY
jgi:serine/threonine protein kinase